MKQKSNKRKNKKRRLNKIKILAWYELVISVLVAILSIYLFFSLGFLPLNFFIAIIGIVGGVYLIKNMRAGFYISLLWAGLQIINFQIGNLSIDFSQLIFFNFPYLAITELQNYPDIVIHPNLVGAILLILLIIWRKNK